MTFLRRFRLRVPLLRVALLSAVVAVASAGCLGLDAEFGLENGLVDTAFVIAVDADAAGLSGYTRSDVFEAIVDPEAGVMSDWSDRTDVQSERYEEDNNVGARIVVSDVPVDDFNRLIPDGPRYFRNGDEWEFRMPLDTGPFADVVKVDELVLDQFLGPSRTEQQQRLSSELIDELNVQVRADVRASAPGKPDGGNADVTSENEYIWRVQLDDERSALIGRWKPGTPRDASLVLPIAGITLMGIALIALVWWLAFGRRTSN